MRGERLQRGSYEIKSVSASAEWVEQRLNLAQFNWTDAAGEFSGQASWNLASRRGQFQARSSIQAKEALDAFGFTKILADATFAAPPLIEISGALDFSGATPPLSAIGRVVLGNFTYKRVPLLGLAADYSWDGTRTMLRDVRLRHASGELLADLLDTPGDFRLNLESSLNPTAFRALVSGDLQKFVGEWELPRSPSVRLSVRGESRDPETWKGEGTIAVARARFRGVWMNSATSDFRFGDRALVFNNLRVTRDEGVGTGAFTYDFGHHEVRVENVQTTLRPADIIYWIEPKLFKVVAPYKFRSPPHLTANGVVQYRGGETTRLEIGIEAPGGLDYFFLGKTLPFGATRGRLLITDERVQVLDLDGKLFDGAVRGQVDIRTEQKEPEYTAAITVAGIDFPRLTTLYFDYETARGQLSGNYDFRGVGDAARTMSGSGKVRVSNGNVFAIPVFGPLSGFVAAIIPGAGYSVAKEATASFTIRDGVIKTDDFKVSGKLFGIVGHGKILFLEDKLDFDVRISASGPGVLLTPVYSLFEYKGEGSLAKPNWHPKRF